MRKLIVCLALTIFTPLALSACTTPAGDTQRMAKWCENTPSCTCAAPSCMDTQSRN